jgi:O-antigen/teichoic acid export membrane protein
MSKGVVTSRDGASGADDADPRAARPTPPASDAAAKAGRGTIFITLAKLWFMVTGAAIVFVLPRRLTTVEYGLYGVTIAIVSVLNDVVVKGTTQTVSKFVSQTPELAPAIKRKAFQLQALVGCGAAAAFALLAPWIAERQKDATLTPYLRLAALITASYAFYSVFVGVLNGRKDFFRQAALDAFYATVKAALIVGFVFAGLGVAGAISGFAAAAFVVLAVSLVVVGGRGRAADSPVGMGELLRFQLGLVAFLTLNNLLMRADLLLIKPLIAGGADEASAAAGVYNGVLQFAYITFQIILSITFVVFPLVSEATFKADLDTARGYIRQTVRAAVMISALPAVLFSANAAEVLRLVFPEEYTAGAPALRVVAFGMLSFAVITVLTTVISSGGRPWVSVGMVAATLAIDVALNFALIPRAGLAGAALATTAAMTAGAAMCAVYVHSRYGAVVRGLTLARVAAAAAAVYALSLVAPSGEWLASLGAGSLTVKAAVAVECAALGVVYVALLFALREVGGEEIRLAKRIAGFK